MLTKVWGALVSCLGSLTPKAHLCPDRRLSHLPGSAWLSASPAWALQADKLLKLFHRIRRNLQGHYLCLLIFLGESRLRLREEDWLYPGHTTKQESCLSISLCWGSLASSVPFFPFLTDALSSLLQGGQSLSFSLGLALSETEKTYNWVTSIAFRTACGLSCT